MAIEDYLEPEVVVAVAITAAVASPTVRGILRKGAVYGMAGLMVAGDAVSTLARGVGRGVQQVATTAQATVRENGAKPARQAAAPRTARRRPQTTRRKTNTTRASTKKESAKNE